MNDDVLISRGGELKALDDAGRVGGYLVLFGDAETTDASAKRDYFTVETDFGLDIAAKSRVLYNHGLDPRLGNRSLGVAELKADDVGVWMEGQLALRDDYEKKVWAMVRAKKQGLSSGTASHLVRRERQPNGAHKVLSWPLGLDASITPTPAEPRTTARAIKSLAELKGAALGEHVGPSVAAAGLERLHYATVGAVGEHMRDAKRSRGERMAACKACLDEHHATAMKLIDALLADDDGDEGAAIKLITESSARLHAGLRLASHLDAVRAAVKGLSDRLADYARLKRDDGRRVPPERREAIKGLVADLAAVLTATEPTADPAESLSLYDQFLALDSRLAGI